MRSFTKKNTAYICNKNIAGTDYDTGDSLYKLLYTNGTNNHIQLLRNEFGTPAFKKAAKAIISLAVQLKKNDWDIANPLMPLNIDGIIDIVELKGIFDTIAQKDYIINNDGHNPQDLFASPQPGKTVDFNTIKNTDLVKFPDIEKLIIETQFFNSEKIKDILTRPPFDLDKAPISISAVVIKNAANLVVLKQVLQTVQLRSGYENLYGFKYPDAANAKKIKLNCFVYKSVVPVTDAVLLLLKTAVTEANKIMVDKKIKCDTIINAAMAVEQTAIYFKNYIDNDNKPTQQNIKTIQQYLTTVTKITSMAGQKNAIASITALLNAVKSLAGTKKLSACTTIFNEGLKEAINTTKAVSKSNPVILNTPALTTILATINNAFENLQRQIDNTAVLNSSNYSTNHQVSDFERVVAGTDIIAPQNRAISGLAPNHLCFLEVIGEINWKRQEMIENIDAAGFSIIPFDEGERVVDGYINSDTRDKSNNSIEKQGYLLMNYIRPHCEPAQADNGYRIAKPTMIFRQGLYCAFCETPFTDGRIVDIEHKLPKANFPTQGLNWNNFVLSCKVCNSDNKGEKYINSLSVEGDIKMKFLTNPFLSRSNPGTRNYLECRNIAEQEVLWPDKMHDPVAGNNAHQLLSFQAITSRMPAGINLASIQATTHAFVHTKGAGANKTHQIDIIGLANGISGNDVSIPFQKANNLPANVNNVGIQASTDHIISICGLDKINASYWNDQRIVSRTKAWLNAMKQLKIIAEFRADKFKNLYNYYQEQLHPINIKHNPNAPNRNNIGNLRDDTAAAIALADISGSIQVPKNIPNGEVKISLTASLTASGTVSINGGNQNAVAIDAGNLAGEITEAGGHRAFTGRIEMGAGIANIGGKIILLKDAAVSNPADPTKFTINIGQGIISDNAQIGTTGSPAEILKEWDSNRADMLRIIDQASTILKDYIWENTLDMVRSGGFYSTWVRTFLDYSSTNAPYSLELLHRLETKALDSPEDPFQFHGTNVEEMVACL